MKYSHNYWSQYTCGQCHNFKPCINFKRKGNCSVYKKQRHAPSAACKYFIPLQKCPVCKVRPIDHDDIMEICKVCRYDLNTDTSSSYANQELFEEL